VQRTHAKAAQRRSRNTMADTIWMGLFPGQQSTRVLAMRGADRPILKAQLDLRPSSPLAVVSLMEAIALWEGMQVHAALVVGEDCSHAQTTLYRDTFAIHGEQSALYRLQWVPRAPRRTRRRGDGLSGLGDFRDLERLLVTAVTR
jgi:hypothetical protein